MPLDSIGLWHDARPAVLDRALLTARRACPNLSAFANFMLPHLPKSTIASHNIRSTDVEPYSEQASLGYAITLPWFALDNETYTNAIVIDADHPNGLERAEYIASQFHIPRPTVVSDPWSGFSHIVWLLAAPVHVGAAKANRYLRFAGQLLALAVGGTHLGRRALVKSPWGRRANLEGKLRRRTDTPCWMWQIHQASGSQLIWHTTPGDQQAVALRDIVAALEPAYGVTARALKPAREPNAEREPSQAGRNCELFDRTRFWACTSIIAATKPRSLITRRPSTAPSLSHYQRRKWPASSSPSPATWPHTTAAPVSVAATHAPASASQHWRSSNSAQGCRPGPDAPRRTAPSPPRGSSSRPPADASRKQRSQPLQAFV